MSELLQADKQKVLDTFKNGSKEEQSLLLKLFPSAFTDDRLKRILSFIDICDELDEDPGDFVPKPGMTEDELHELYSRKMKLIYKAFNVVWKPDFDNKDEAKYYPWFEKKNDGFVLDYVAYYYGYTNVGSRLCSHSEEIVQHICTHFLKEYNDYLLS